MRTRKLISPKGKPKFAVIVDGETEFWYLQMLKRNEQLVKVDIKPEIPQKKKLADQFSKVIELSAVYDKVFWVVDMDTILNESLQAKKVAEKPVDSLFAYKKVIERKHNNVVVIINQPCLEFWFLTHFVATTKSFANCDEAGKDLTKHIKDYTKTEKFFVKQNDDIYIKLRPRLEEAIARSRKMPAFDKDSPCSGLTEMHKFFDSLDIGR
jgi:hypothetical protein